MTLIDKEKALKTIKEQRDLALQREYDTPTNSPCYTRYSAQASERSRFYDFLETQSAVPAIPRDKVNQAREEMESKLYKGIPETTGFTWQNLGINMCLEILDKLIAESEK